MYPRNCDCISDPLGRLAAVQSGTFVLFDDKNWTDIFARETENRSLVEIASAADGRTYFGGPGVWGYLEFLPDGSVAPKSLRTGDEPSWVSNNTFGWVVPLSTGVVFCGEAGALHYDFDSGRQQFFAAPDVVFAFGVNGQAFVSSYRWGLCRVDPVKGELVRLEEMPTKTMIVERATRWDETRVLVVNHARAPRAFSMGNGSSPGRPRSTTCCRTGSK